MKNVNKLIHKLNKRGSGMVAVIVAIALVSTLCSIMLVTSYMNYKMKATDLRAKNNFYSAETALNEIRIGLEAIVSDALGDAYLEVFENYNSYATDVKNSLFEEKYYDRLYRSVAAADSYTYSQYDINLLRSFVTEPWDEATGTGCIVSSDTRSMITYSKTGIILKDIEVYYKDAQGYSSIITTDIKLSDPQLDFGAVTAVPNIIDYSLIADTKLVVKGNAGVPTVVKGNAYGGNILVDSNLASFEPTQFLIAKNDFTMKNATVTFPSDESRDCEIWASNFVPESSNVTVDIPLMLSNDVNIKGNSSVLKITNKLNGFGTSTTDADKSSSIVINGKNSTLDFTSAQVVTIAGHAFVGTKNAAAINGVSATGSSDVYTGESIAVKGDQIMYLAPPECVGVTKTTEEIDGVQVTKHLKSKFNENPLTASHYAELVNNPALYDIIATDVKVNNLDNYLSFYTEYEGDGVLSAEYIPVTVQTNGETLVYIYLSFGSEMKANRYVQDYYGKNKDKVDRYVKYYASKIVIPNRADMVRLQLAGNAITYNSGNADMKENTVENAASKLGSSDVVYNREKDALCTKLLMDYSEVGSVSDNDLSHNVLFSNIINVGFLNANAASTLTFEDDSVCVITKGDYDFNGNGVKPTVLIIANGNVNVNADFSGLIFASGTITVSPGVTVTSNPTEVSNALWYKHASSEIFVYDFFVDGSGMARRSDGGKANSKSLELKDLVVYENWKKK